MELTVLFLTTFYIFVFIGTDQYSPDPAARKLLFATETIIEIMTSQNTELRIPAPVQTSTKQLLHPRLRDHCRIGAERV